MIHFFLPDTVAFHALVQLGSTWNEEPERAGPAISQRWSGRCSSPSTENKSSCIVLRIRQAEGEA